MHILTVFLTNAAYFSDFTDLYMLALEMYPLM